jgi:hypothetical protein
LELPAHRHDLDLGLELADDVSAADWLDDALRPWTRPGDDGPVWVASFVPDSYEAFARILHPLRWATTGGGRWSERWRGSARHLRSTPAHRTTASSASGPGPVFGAATAARPYYGHLADGGSQAAIDDVLAPPGLEAIAVTAQTPLDPGLH